MTVDRHRSAGLVHAAEPRDGDEDAPVVARRQLPCGQEHGTVTVFRRLRRCQQRRLVHRAAEALPAGIADRVAADPTPVRLDPGLSEPGPVFR